MFVCVNFGCLFLDIKDLCAEGFVFDVKLEDEDGLELPAPAPNGYQEEVVVGNGNLIIGVYVIW